MQETGFDLMAKTAPVFARMAQMTGLKPKGSYTMGEVCRASGVSYTTVRTETRSGRLKAKLPKGRERGRRVEPESFDEWWKEQDAC